MFLSSLLEGMTKNEALETVRKSGVNMEVSAKPVEEGDYKVKEEKEEERYGVNFSEGRGYDVSDEELKKIGGGMGEVEMQERKEKKKMRESRS